jgi:hypothetical protein
VLLGVLLDVALGEFGEGALAALGLLLGRRVLATGYRKHRLGRERARIAEADGVGITDVEPAGATVKGVDRLPGFGSGRLYAQGETVLAGIPDDEGGDLWLDLADEQFGEVQFSKRVSRHDRVFSPANSRLIGDAKLSLTPC